MQLDVKPGTYVVAVSGGVDSMVLLDMLAGRSGLRLVVAHFDHGIRSDSPEDRRLVQTTAKRYGLPFVYTEGRLGPGASEAAARRARYTFLDRVRQASGARAIITAHHQDDLLETAILNILRGTGRKGLTSLATRPGFIRPLLHVSKEELLAYATAHRLQWREDSTNIDERHLRNYIRRRLLPRFSAADRQRLAGIIEQAHVTNRALDAELGNLMHLQPGTYTLDRRWFVRLPHREAREFLASWLRERGVSGFDARTLERVVVAAKTLRPGSAIDVTAKAVLRVSRDDLALDHHER